LPPQVDRIFERVPRALRLLDAGAGGASLTLGLEGFADAVLWNPAAAKAATMADLSGFRTFVCIEPAVVAAPITLAPGESWSGAQTLSILA
jgi:glucose-6-phosphate 1-epimerase